MSKRTKAKPNAGSEISWKRVRALFGNPQPPVDVWERQFDGCDETLQKLAQTPYDQIDFSDLWEYYHDLAYVELQPELFHYLFPVCLIDWHETLLRNQSCAHGDAEFHYGLIWGDVLHKMMTETQRIEVGRFFHDSFLQRLDMESELGTTGCGASAYGWLARFNSLARIMPIIADIWRTWWQLETTGRALSAVQYLSGLIYFDGENPVFDIWTTQKRTGGPDLWAHDSMIYSTGWTSENVTFLAGVLNFDFVASHLHQATTKLEGHPAHRIAAQVLADLPARQEIVEQRTAELPKLLEDHRAERWSV